MCCVSIYPPIHSIFAHTYNTPTTHLLLNMSQFSLNAIGGTGGAGGDDERGKDRELGRGMVLGMRM